ncbi:hypothetical protein VTO42DRAFT_686 [Malbranchea cinnamomea]
MSLTAAGVSRTDSLEAQDPHHGPDEDKKKKNRRPANTAFRQQRLKAWQPILTPKTVLPLFFIVGIIFAPIGGLLIWASSQVEELVIDYSKCAEDAPFGQENAASIPSDKVHYSFRSNNQTSAPSWWKTERELEINTNVFHNTTVCSLLFEIPNDIGPSVFLYYRLSNFYQNHRRYVKSLNLDQLKGKFVSNSSVSGSTCDPIRTDDQGKAYFPCGLIANSLFNDTFASPIRVGGSTNETYPMTNKGISWSSDRDLFKKTEYQWYDVVPPPNWAVKYPNNYTEENPPPNLQEYEEFQVWMRTAGLPTFSKLARRNDNETMRAGMYQLDIAYHFPVTVYGGTKSVVITTTTVVGGKNPFMGIAYVIVGGICIVLGGVFTFAHLIKPRKLGDHRYLTWNNEQPSTATATGRDPRFGR